MKPARARPADVPGFLLSRTPARRGSLAVEQRYIEMVAERLSARRAARMT